ncbi:hypothetical protein ACP70R_006616 [Stipagrostis hirtigluma subsp. patula]
MGVELNTSSPWAGVGSSSSSSSARRVKRPKQDKNVFEELISKIEHAEFQLPQTVIRWTLDYYKPIKRNGMYIALRNALKIMTATDAVLLLFIKL